MDITRLKSWRAGNRAVVTKTLNKLEDAIKQENVETEAISSLLQAVERRKKTLSDIDEQILSAVETDGMTEELLETDEYYCEIDSKIRKFNKYLKPTINATSSALPTITSEFVPQSSAESPSSNFPTSALRTTAPEFVPNSHSEYTHSSQEFLQSSSHSSQNHRLPKLSLPEFYGDILEWQYFWESFDSTIHKNHTLTDVQKFSYLKSLLKSDAASVISGLTMTNHNYKKAIELLSSRYGQTHQVTNAYMRVLLDMPAPDERLENIRLFYDKSEAYIRCLESLGQCQEMFGSLLIPVIIGKLPLNFRTNITRENGSDNWTIGKVRKSICKELTIQESSKNNYIYASQIATPTANFVAGVRKDKTRTEKHTKTVDKYRAVNQKKCVYCEGNHSSIDCRDVIDHEKRITIIKEKKLCFNCFGTHRVSDCPSRYDCRNCHRKHHTSLCQKGKDRKPEHEKSEKTEVKCYYTSATQETCTVLLKTAIAEVTSENDHAEANILFDEGAQRSFISQELANKLNAKIEGSETLNIASFGNETTGVRNLDKTTVQLKATDGEVIPIKVLIVPNIASPIQNQTRKITQNMHYLRNLSLAHPISDAESFEISLLIGADFYWNIVQDHVIRGNGPTAVNSKLGYLLSGPVPVPNEKKSASMMNVLISHNQTNFDLEKFWKLENIGIDTKETDTSSDRRNEIENFVKTSISKQNGKYVSKLPWKENCPELPTNEEIVKRRTENVIRRISKDGEMLKLYGDIITDQETRGFIEKVSENDTTDNRIHYIPHHPVKKDSATTPIRIVYNCSCKANENSASLNDCLADYPPMMNELTSILTRFRMEKYAVIADIEKAFLQIELDKTDRDVTRFYWLENPKDPNSRLITYRFKVVLFGAVCSPFLLSATLMKHFRDNPSATSSELQRNLYVDNALTSFHDESELLNFYKESVKLLSDAGFNLRSWNSNSDKLIDRAKNNISFTNVLNIIPRSSVKFPKGCEIFGTPSCTKMFNKLLLSL